MPSNDIPLVLEKVKPEEEPYTLVQTGYDTLDVNIINVPLYSDDTLDTDMLALPSARLVAGDQGDLEAASPSHFVAKSDDTGVLYMDYILDLLAQAERFIICVGQKKVWPNMASSTVALNGVFPFIKRGVLGLPPPRFPNDWDFTEDADDATGLSDQLAGQVWKDTAELGTKVNHWQQVGRIAYAWAISQFKQFPEFWHRLEQQADIVQERTIWIYTLAFVIQWAYVIPIAACQSDRAAFLLGFKQVNAINKKIDAGLAGPLDPIWEQFVELVKYQYLATPMKDQDCFVGTFINVGLIAGQTLEDSIHDYSMVFRVPDFALKMARQMFGIGKCTSRGTNENFAILLNLACYAKQHAGGPLNITKVPGHGETEWGVGLQFYHVQKIFRDLVMLERDWKLMLKQSKHQTWTDVVGNLADMFTDFSVMTSINGTAENDAWRGLKSVVNYGTTADSGWDYGSSVQDISSMATDDAWDDTVCFGTIWPYFYFGYGNSFPKNRLWLLHNWSELELSYWIKWGMLLDTGDSVIGPDKGALKTNERYWCYCLRLVQLIEARTGNVRGLLKMHGDHTEARWQKVKSRINSGYPSIDTEYTVSYGNMTIDSQEVYQPERPLAKTWNGSSTMFIGNIGENSVCQAALKMFAGSNSSAKVAESKSAEPSAPKGPVGPVSAKGDKESEGL